jgi:hypothetical protein
MTIDEVVGNLANRLEHDGVFQHREVAFVAHSLGGLIVQRFLLTHREYAPNGRFIYFFRPPKPARKSQSWGLEREWRSAHFENIHRYCAYEKKKMAGVLVVDRLSGTRNCESGVAIGENHGGIVKPCSTSNDAYIALQNAVQGNAVAPRLIPKKVETVTRNCLTNRWVVTRRTGRR